MTSEGGYLPSTRDWVRDQVARYEQSGGREANTLRETGIPIIVVTMRGAKTGAIRKTAVMRVEHNGQYALIASQGGAPTHPNWYFNLVAHPDDVLVQDGLQPVPMRVREVSGAVRAEWWARAVAVFPDYDDYQARTDRVIPLLVATPRPDHSL